MSLRAYALNDVWGLPQTNTTSNPHDTPSSTTTRLAELRQIVTKRDDSKELSIPRRVDANNNRQDNDDVDRDQPPPLRRSTPSRSNNNGNSARVRKKQWASRPRDSDGGDDSDDDDIYGGDGRARTDNVAGTIVEKDTLRKSNIHPSTIKVPATALYIAIVLFIVVAVYVIATLRHMHHQMAVVVPLLATLNGFTCRQNVAPTMPQQQR